MRFLVIIAMAFSATAAFAGGPSAPVPPPGFGDTYVDQQGNVDQSGDNNISVYIYGDNNTVLIDPNSGGQYFDGDDGCNQCGHAPPVLPAHPYCGVRAYGHNWEIYLIYPNGGSVLQASGYGHQNFLTAKRDLYNWGRCPNM